MNKQEIQNQIEILEKELETLKLKVKECDKPVKRWRAEEDGKYYCLDGCGYICSDLEDDRNITNFRYSIGNYFKTQEEAEKYKENLILKQQLKDIALELNDGVEIDWADRNQEKYRICFDYTTKRYSRDISLTWMQSGIIYCLSDKFLEVALERIGEAKLKQLIESGV